MEFSCYQSFTNPPALCGFEALGFASGSALQISSVADSEVLLGTGDTESLLSFSDSRAETGAHITVSATPTCLSHLVLTFGWQFLPLALHHWSGYVASKPRRHCIPTLCDPVVA